MDANGDGKLTKDEVKADREARSPRSDADEDECLSMHELIPNLYDPRLRGQVQFKFGSPTGGRSRSHADPDWSSTYEPGRIPGTLTQQVIKKYDKDGDFELTRDEFGFDDVTFSRGSTGTATASSTARNSTCGGPARRTSTSSLSLAPKAVGLRREAETDAKRPRPRGFKRQAGRGRAAGRPHAAGSRSTSGPSPPVVANSQQPLKQQYQYLFQQAAGGKDHVVEKDLTGPNAVQFQFIRTLFDAADRNGDGKLTQAEFDAYFDLQDSFRNVALASPRRCRRRRCSSCSTRTATGGSASANSAPRGTGSSCWRPGNATSSRRRRSSRRSRCGCRAGSTGSTSTSPVRAGYQQPEPAVPVPQKGPMWFRKMDRNARRRRVAERVPRHEGRVRRDRHRRGRPHQPGGSRDLRRKLRPRKGRRTRNQRSNVGAPT